MSLAKFIAERQKIKGKFDHVEGDIVPFQPDVLRQEFEQGLAQADRCGIYHIDNLFAWKRGDQNCFTGYPNDGKSQFTLFLMVIKSLLDGWKWVVWSPEMRSAQFVDGKVQINYNEFMADIAWMLEGVTPYKHIAEKYNIKRMTVEKFLVLCEWVNNHFTFIDPKDRTPGNIHTLLKKIYNDQGYDAVLIDPFKNLKQDIDKRTDLYLDGIFSTFGDFALEHNIVFNWIAHPKANIQRTQMRDGVPTLMPCDQWMLNGGASWDNNMDGIYTPFRPNRLDDPQDPAVWFINLKQRKQALVAKRGKAEDIYMDIRTNRYIFNNVDVMNMHLNKGNQTSDFEKKDDEPF